MKVNEKRLVQYGFAVLIAIAFVYYYCFFVPTERRIAEYENEKFLKMKKLDDNLLQAMKEREIDDLILAANRGIEEMDRKVFVNISQAEALMILSELNPDGRLVFDSVSLMEKEETDSTDFYDVSLRVDFTGDFYDVMSFIERIQKYEKNISILGAGFEVSKFHAMDDIDSDASGSAYLGKSDVSGDARGDASGEEGPGVRRGVAKLIVSMRLRFTSVPRLSELGWQDREMIHSIRAQRELENGPFYIYPEYLDALRLRKQSENNYGRQPEFEKESETVRESDSSEGESQMIDSEAAVVIPPGTSETQRQEGRSQDGFIIQRPQYSAGFEFQGSRALCQDFEDGGFFFVGSDNQMEGDVSNSVLTMNGNYSADFRFDYMFSRPVNVASLAFIEPQMIQIPAESVLLQVYSYAFTGHEIGIVVIDSLKKEHRIVLSPYVDWVGWKELYSKLPSDMEYPCIVQRIYVEGRGREQTKAGRYLFDQLEFEHGTP